MRQPAYHHRSYRNRLPRGTAVGGALSASAGKVREALGQAIGLACGEPTGLWRLQPGTLPERCLSLAVARRLPARSSVAFHLPAGRAAAQGAQGVVSTPRIGVDSANRHPFAALPCAV